jgi:hypothetical protein
MTTGNIRERLRGMSRSRTFGSWAICKNQTVTTHREISENRGCSVACPKFDWWIVVRPSSDLVQVISQKLVMIQPESETMHQAVRLGSVATEGGPFHFFLQRAISPSLVFPSFDFSTMARFHFGMAICGRKAPVLSTAAYVTGSAQSHRHGALQQPRSSPR